MFDLAEYEEWLSVPTEELAEKASLPVTVLATKADLYEHFASSMFDEISAAGGAHEKISLIVPIGPKRHYPLLAQKVNDAGLSLKHVTFFGMDNWLDWQGRPLPWEHPCNMEGYFHRYFLEDVLEELRPDPQNVIFPDPMNIDRSATEMAERGPVATCYGGFGFQGHLAFNEPPGSRWSPVSLEELKTSRTRILPIAVDTIIAHAERSLGGNVFAVPPMAITLGMSELLAAKRIRLYTDGGTWKHTIVRILLFAEPTPDYPVTLVRDHPDVELIIDEASALPPSQIW